MHGGAELPSYYDPQYRCQMEVLRFDSSVPDASCVKWVEQLSACLVEVSVVVAREPAPCLLPQAVHPGQWSSVPHLGWVT